MARPKRICSIDGCNKPHFGRGWCSAHYYRACTHGVPLGGGTSPGEALAFLENTVLSFVGDECLIWPYSTNCNGYGRIRRDGKTLIVSRIACEAEHGPPPTPKHQAAHNCGKGHLGCVNRKHLEWKTPGENTTDKWAHGTVLQGERHGRAKLTEAQVLEIRAARGTQAAIASCFGVTRATVGDIKTRRRWAHV